MSSNTTPNTWRLHLTTLETRTFNSQEFQNTLQFQDKADPATRTEMAKLLSEAIHEEADARRNDQTKARPLNGHFWAVCGVLFMNIAQTETEIEQAFLWLKAGMKINPYTQKLERFIHKAFDIIINKDDPELFKRWAIESRTDLLAPYVQACHMNKTNIMRTFAEKQAKRQNNRVLKSAIYDNDLVMFEFILPYSNLRKNNSSTLRNVVERICECHVALNRTPSINPYINTVRYEAKLKELEFLNKALPMVIPFSDPVQALAQINLRPHSVTRITDLLISPMSHNQLKRAVKIKQLRKNYPSLMSFSQRQKLKYIAKQNSRHSVKQTGPGIKF